MGLIGLTLQEECIDDILIFRNRAQQAASVSVHATGYGSTSFIRQFLNRSHVGKACQASSKRIQKLKRQKRKKFIGVDLLDS